MTVSAITDRLPKALPATSSNVTVETALYVCVLAVALFLRLFRLELSPLSEFEAAQALAALRGSALPPAGSPLLYALNSNLLAMFSAGDAIVRLLPALAGALLALTPALFRDMLGRFGALGASIILALSPLGLVASRSVDGGTIAVGSVLLAIALARRYQATSDERNLIGAAIALGVGLASGPGIYTALVAFAAAALAQRFVMGRVSTEAVWSTWRAATSSPHRLKVIGGLIGALVVASTGGLTRLAGLAGASDVLTGWLNAFGAAGGLQAFDGVQILIVYEMLPLVAGAVGLGRVVRQFRRAGRWPAEQPAVEDLTAPIHSMEPSSAEDSVAPARHVEPPAMESASADVAPDEPAHRSFGAWLAFAAIISLVVIFQQSGRRPVDLLLPVTLLALLAGYAIESWARTTLTQASWPVDGVMCAAGLALAARALLLMAESARGLSRQMVLLGTPVQADVNFVMLETALIVAVAGVVLALLYNVRSVLRAGATVGLAVLALGSLAAGWGATQVRPGDAREIVWGPAVTTPSTRALRDAAEQIAIRSQGHAGTLPIRLEVDDPVVAWYLRDAQIRPGDVVQGVVTLAGEQPRAPEGGYIGSRFTIGAAWDALGLSLDDWIEWALFRTGGEAPAATKQVTLWERR
jgi:hypothetical protein